MNKNMKKLRYYAGVVFTFISITLSCDKPKNDPVNFVFILVDDLGWKDLGCFGSTFYETENIDQLAAKGVLFTNAYSASPECGPGGNFLRPRCASSQKQVGNVGAGNKKNKADQCHEGK